MSVRQLHLSAQAYWPANDLRYLKLDQTPEDQTTIGEFIFPKLGVGGATRPLRGKLDILGETVTIDDVTSSDTSLYFSYSGLYYKYFADGQYRQYDVYAYKTVAGTKIYSQNPLIISGTDDSSAIGMIFNSTSWNAVTGAEGYRIVVTDPTAGYYGDYFFDTPYLNFNFGNNAVGYDDVSGQYLSYGNDIVTKSANSGEDYYLDSNGHLVSTNNFTLSKVFASDGISEFPSHSFLSQPDMGMYRKTLNSLVFAFGGYERVIIDATSLSLNNSLIFRTSGVGSATAPAFSWATDTNNGMFLPTEDTIAFSTAGTERVRIGSTGLVGIGGTAATLFDVIGGQGSFRNPVGTGSADSTSNIQLYDTTSAAANVGGGIAFFGNYTGTSATVGGGIKLLKSNATAGNWGFDLGFYTRLHGGSNTGLGMKLTSNSNLQLGGATTETGRLNIDYAAGGATTWVDLKSGTTSMMQLRYYGTTPWEEFEFYIPKSNAGLNFKTATGGLRIVPWSIGDILYFQSINPNFSISGAGGAAGTKVSFLFGESYFSGKAVLGAPNIQTQKLNVEGSFCVSDASSFCLFLNFGGKNYIQSGLTGAGGGEVAPLIYSGSQGYPELLYMDSAKTYTPQDLGVGVTAPSARLHVIKTTEQLRLGYNTTNYLSFTVGSANAVTIANAVAADININCGTDKTVVLTETVYQDINLGAANFVASSAGYPDKDQFKDEAGADTGVETLAFGVDEGVSSQFEIQHDYKEGTDIVFHVHWQGITAPAGGTDNVQWRLSYTINRDGQTMNAPTVIDSPDKAITAQYQCNRSDFAAIAGATGGYDGGIIKIGDQFIFKLSRVAATADEYGGDALLITAGIHYQIDTLGSRQIGTK